MRHLEDFVRNKKSKRFPASFLLTAAIIVLSAIYLLNRHQYYISTEAANAKQTTVEPLIPLGDSKRVRVLTQSAAIEFGQQRLQLNLLSTQMKATDDGEWWPMTMTGKSQLTLQNSHNNTLAGPTFNTPNAAFKIYHIDGLPQPLILVATVDSIGASQANYTIYPYALSKTSKGQGLISLNPSNVKWQSDSYGGVFVGKLSSGERVGALVWEMLESARSADKHKYRVHVYHWNGKQFVVAKRLTTQQKYSSGEEALKEFGYRVPNMSRDFFIIKDNS